MKKLLIVMMILILLLSGCWDLTESEDLAKVTDMGIDLGGNGDIRVTIKIVNPSAGGGEQGLGGAGCTQFPFRMHSSIGTTISDAVSKLSQEVPQRVSFTHVTTVLLSEELVSFIGFRPVVDFFERNQEMRRNIWVCITKKGKFHEVISVYTPCGFVTAAEMIGSIIDFRKNNLFSTTSRMGDFVEILGHQGQETYTQGTTIKTPVFHTTEPKYRAYKD